MNIKEVEQLTGLPRSNIRFYEKEGLVIPKRNEKNGYREYSDHNVSVIKKIAYLRTLGFSVDEIRKIMDNRLPLSAAVENQVRLLDSQISELANAREMCSAILRDEGITFENLEVERYTPDLKKQWNNNRQIFQSDSVSFLYLWGGTAVWAAMMTICTAAALIFFPYLPKEIPVQWSGREASSLVSRIFIFAYPAACLLIRYPLWPLIWRRVSRYTCYGDLITNYVVNFMCLAVVSVELFTILYVYGIVGDVSVILLTDGGIMAFFLICSRIYRRS